MRFSINSALLALSFAALCSVVAYSQEPTSDATAATPAANLYIQGHKGVYVYNVSSAGKLTLVKGSPVWLSGGMAGARGSYIITAGTDDLRTYKIESNGALGGKVGEIDTQKYAGSQCGTIDGGTLLDHTGLYFTVPLYGGNVGQCAGLQTFKIASNGQFTFLGDVESEDGVHGDTYQIGASTYSSNNLFAYGVENEQGGSGFWAFRRASAGDLVINNSFTEKDPTYNPSNNSYNYAPVIVAADNASHLAVVMNQPFGQNCCQNYSLASYTINNTTGGIVSTNTYQNMPVLKVSAADMAVSWGGNFVAVSGTSATNGGPGLQLFHFNGAAAATDFGGVLLPNVGISEVMWDKDNHLYAFSSSSQELFVYTVTSKSITEAPGSPYKTNGEAWTGFIVASK